MGSILLVGPPVLPSQESALEETKRIASLAKRFENWLQEPYHSVSDDNWDEDWDGEETNEDHFESEHSADWPEWAELLRKTWNEVEEQNSMGFDFSEFIEYAQCLEEQLFSLVKTWRDPEGECSHSGRFLGFKIIATTENMEEELWPILEMKNFLEIELEIKHIEETDEDTDDDDEWDE